MAQPSAPPYNQHDDFYNKPAAPPLPQHIETTRDSTDKYALNDVPVNSPSPYPVYNQHGSSGLPPGPTPLGHSLNDHHHRDSMSDMKFIDHYDSDDDLEKIIPREKKKRSCMDKMCCGCCTCCPKWARWCSCIFLIIFIILAIIAGVFAAIFKVPVVQFTGLKQDPVVTNLNNVLTMTFEVGISVDNPNFAGITFETIKADVSTLTEITQAYADVFCLGLLPCTIQCLYWWWKRIRRSHRCQRNNKYRLSVLSQSQFFRSRPTRCIDGFGYALWIRWK
jgi:hypothetical protein